MQRDISGNLFAKFNLILLILYFVQVKHSYFSLNHLSFYFKKLNDAQLSLKSRTYFDYIYWNHSKMPWFHTLLLLKFDRNFKTEISRRDSNGESSPDFPVTKGILEKNPQKFAVTLPHWSLCRDSKVDYIWI